MADRAGGGVRLGLRPAGRIQRAAAARAAGRVTPFLPWLVALVALNLTVSLVYSRYLFADSYYDLYAGRYIVQHGIPHHNVVTAVAHGASWIDQQWLAHVLYYAAWAAGGYPAVAVLSSLVLTSSFAVLALAMRSRGVPCRGCLGGHSPGPRVPRARCRRCGERAVHAVRHRGDRLLQEREPGGAGAEPLRHRMAAAEPAVPGQHRVLRAADRMRGRG